jgi:PPOX class probable F420-dependent enzyme
MTIPEGYKDLLESKALAHVATIGPSGEPQVNPVWFGWDGKHIKFSQTKTRQKTKNLQRNPHVALSIVDPENPYRYLEIRGKVVRVDEDPDKGFIDEMANKYMGVEKYPWNQPGDERIIMVVEPEHTTQMG